MPVAAAMIVTAHASDAMVAIPFWLEMFAVVAASISGVLVAREHKLDLVGAVALAVVCGLGGGLLRDMTLQVGNVYILNQPMALPLSIATAAIIYIFPAIVDKPEKLIPLLDIISVGIYAATGADKALVYGFAHTSIKIRRRTGKRTIFQNCFSILNSYFLSSKLICTIFHPCRTHRITDEDHTLRSEHPKCCADCRRMNVISVADQLNHALRIIHCRTDQSRCSVSKRLHRIVKMRNMMRTKLHCS